MPEKLKNYQFPVTYAPWYVYDATIRRTREIYKFDVVLPTTADKSEYQHFTGAAGNTNNSDLPLAAGYAICLENVETDADNPTITAQVAMPGSAIPGVVNGEVAQGALVKARYVSATDGILLVEANAADLAAGKVLGRLRVSLADNNFLQKTSTNGKDPVIVQTGVV